MNPKIKENNIIQYTEEIIYRKLLGNNEEELKKSLEYFKEKLKDKSLSTKQLNKYQMNINKIEEKIRNKDFDNSDQLLNDSCIIVDEAHVKNIATDMIINLVANKMLNNINHNKPNKIKLIIASATMDQLETNYNTGLYQILSKLNFTYPRMHIGIGTTFKVIKKMIINLNQIFKSFMKIIEFNL